MPPAEHVSRARAGIEQRLALLDLVSKHSDDDNLDPGLANIDLDELPPPTHSPPRKIQ